MPHKVFKKWISSLSSFFIVILISACSDSGTSSNSAANGSGRTLEVPESNIVLEGASGETQSLSMLFTSPVTGNLTYQSFNITAAEKSDYRPVSAAIEALEGESYSIAVDIFGDSEIEGDEQFGISVFDDTGTELLVLVAQISNDDLPNLTINTPTISEGDFGTARLGFTLSLNSPVVDPYEITVSTVECEQWVDLSSGNERYATPCVDFDTLNTTLTFTGDVQSLEFDVVVISDDIVELDELVVVNITSNEVEALVGGGVALGTIRTDETPNDQGFSLSASSQILNEDFNNVGGDGGNEANDNLWQLVNYKVDVVNPENIIQAQYIEFNLKGDESAQEGGALVLSLIHI